MRRLTHTARAALILGLTASLTTALWAQPATEPAPGPAPAAPVQEETMLPSVTAPPGGPVKPEHVVIPEAATPSQLEAMLDAADEVVEGRTDLDTADRWRLFTYLVVGISDRIIADSQAPAALISDAQRAKFSVLYQGSQYLPEEFIPPAKAYFAELLKQQPEGPYAGPCAAMLYRFEYLDPAKLPDDAVAKAMDLLNAYPRSPIVASALVQLTGKLEAAGRVDEARNVLEQALAIARETSPQMAALLESELAGLAILGQPLDIAGPTVDGGNFDLKDLRGKVVLVDYWATWCGPCVAEMPKLKETYAKYRDQGFEIVGISADDDPDALSSFVGEMQIGWPQIFFPEQARGEQSPMVEKYDVQVFPTQYLVGKDGTVIARGLRGEGELEGAVRRALGLKEETTSEQ